MAYEMALGNAKEIDTGEYEPAQFYEEWNHIGKRVSWGRNKNL